MKCTEKKIKIRDLVAGYSDESEFGGPIVGYFGKLNIRPAYQREFVYRKDRQMAVIDTILGGWPLNNMYWAVSPDGTYELVDGQQRTNSIALYVAENTYSVKIDEKDKYFHSLSKEIQDKILDYELNVVFIEGTEAEKLKWFERINIAGMALEPQELRNSVFTGPWLTDAKKFFSKFTCPAKKITTGYWNLKEGWNRQKGLEHALSWVADRDGCSIEAYMSKHQKDADASDLINFFTEVMGWVKKTFPHTYKEMESIYEFDWYKMYKYHHTETLNPDELDTEIKRLLADEDVEKKKGIWEYVLDHNECHLNLRVFPESIKLKKYREQDGICPIDGKWHPYEEMEADHKIPWSKGGSTDIDNCQMIWKHANRVKSDK